MKKKDTTGGASDWTSAPAGRRITPLEVQQKEFQVARFGAGYRMREVDEFLDQVTDAMTALVAENERLARGSSDRGPASTRPSVPATTGDADRAAVEAFLRREKGFLQDLGGLVQEHAEELRSMVRAVRQDASAVAEIAVQEPAAKEPPAAARASDAGSAPEEAPPLEAAAAPDAREEPDAPQAEITEGSDVSGTTAQATPDAPEDEREDEGEGDDRTTIAGSAPIITGAVADEPILLDEPEPARSGRPDDEEDGSLRELFWGEE
ncbi:MAG TPA: DivIVA domain-containing protein [Actinomycetota bacterium]|nr:DivIVA domain-containing protein [Actinomycetota bacterium]